jgi:hypothetical protein
MVKKLLLLVTLGVTLSGCFMAPMALIGPASSGWSTASIIQSGVGSGASYLIEKSTGKSISEHAFDALNKEPLHQTLLPEEEEEVSFTFKKINAELELK